MDYELEKMASEFGSRVRENASENDSLHRNRANSVSHLAQPIVDFIANLTKEASKADGISFSILESTIRTSEKYRFPTLNVRVIDNNNSSAVHECKFVFENDVTIFGELRANQRVNYKVLYEQILRQFEGSIRFISKPQAIQPNA